MKRRKSVSSVFEEVGRFWRVRVGHF